MNNDFFGVCKDNTLIYSTNFIDPFLVNIVLAMSEIGEIYLEDTLQSVEMNPLIIYVKKENGFVYFSKDRNINKYIVDYHKLYL